MIKSLSIKDFESHRDSELEFSPGVNVLVGASDKGKSSVLRTLQVAIKNEPAGEDFISWGTDETILKLKTTDGIEVTRKKGKSNLYCLKVGDGKEMEFKAFGQNVPDEIKKALNLFEVNFHKQLDNPFLLTESPGFVADHFNKVARIDKINSTTKNINSAITSIKSDIGKLEKDITKFNQELSEFPDLEKIEVELEMLEDLEKERNKIASAISELGNLIRRIDLVEEKIEQESDLLPLESEVESLLNRITQRDKLGTEINQLSGLLENIEMIDTKIKKFNRNIRLGGLVDSILVDLGESKAITGDLRTLNGLVGKLYVLDQNIVKTQENVVRMETRFKTEMGSVCLLCGSKLK